MIASTNVSFVDNLEKATESKLGWTATKSDEEWSFWINFDRNGARDDDNGA